MISFLKNLKPNKLKPKSYKLNRGMTYVELIVVLSIFSVMTSVVLFDYGNFQAKVDIKVLANDIALKIVEAQKASVSGKWNTNAGVDWKPSYGIYLDRTQSKIIVPFVDLNSNNIFDGSNCSGECLDAYINITKNNFIEDIECSGSSFNNINIVFRRPDSTAIMTSSIGGQCFGDIDITISSPGTKPNKAHIIVSPSGRIQIN